MNHEEIIALDNQYIAHTYGRLPVVPAKGKNATLFDENGKKYIDFTSGIGVNSLGFSNDCWVAAVTEQLNAFQHISNYYYSAPTSLLAKTLCDNTGMKKVFFGNSGAEANEGAIKTARKYSFDKYCKGRSTIITLRQSFHGRTVTTLAATGQDVFHDFFFPFTEGFKYVEPGDIEALKEALTDDVCAVMAEPIQGEGGVNILSQKYLKELETLCCEKDILLIFDEVQTGAGRTGKLYAFQNYDIKPDLVTSAKGLGGGLPIGAVLLGEKCADVLGPSQHGTTFGGNPVVCAGANAVMDNLLRPGFLEAVTDKGNYIKNKIAAMELDAVSDIRGLGLMIGITVRTSPKVYLKRAEEAGLLILTAGSDVLRLLPPLTISYDEIDEGLAIFEKILREEV